MASKCNDNDYNNSNNKKKHNNKYNKTAAATVALEQFSIEQ